MCVCGRGYVCVCGEGEVGDVCVSVGGKPTIASWFGALVNGVPLRFPHGQVAGDGCLHRGSQARVRHRVRHRAQHLTDRSGGIAQQILGVKPCVYVYVCGYVCMSVCACVYVHVCMCVLCMCVYVYVCVYVYCVCACACVCMCVLQYRVVH